MYDEEIFHQALARRPEERAAFLEQACAGDPALRASVEALLRANVGATGFLEQPAPAPIATVNEQQVHEGPGTVIGPYKLLEPIGEGGFGVVFLAEQTQPVRRKVALKVLKPGMDTRQVVARFEAERQALALMDHPNIARVFDGGATPSGRPYFVMELVKGVPITEFCDQSHLTPRQRLELFVPVCQAVQHAHQKGIIHRDLKPSNVLVSRHDTTPMVKVIDFGVAKALGQELTDKTLFTGIAQMVGTPLYVSPEQAGMSDLDIDTRSDIYSLGVLLYELLTGTTPFTPERLKGVAFDELRRIIREEDPPRPSTRLSESKDTLASISAQRQTEPARLTKLVRGELDWIVMKALEKDRNRRYDSANSFAADVQRYLADEPVLACPPSLAYRFRKFARRNKGALAVAGLILAFLVLLGGSVGWSLRDRAARERERFSERSERRARVAGQVELILQDVERLEREQKWPEALAQAKRAETALVGGDVDPETREMVRAAVADLEMVSQVEDIRLLWSDQAPGRGKRLHDQDIIRLYTRAFREYGVEVEVLAADEAAARLRARPAVCVALAQALDAWAVCRFAIGNEDQAQRLWSLASAIDPDPWRAKVRRAGAAQDFKDLDQLARGEEAATQPVVSQVMLSSLLLRAGRPAQALRVLERAGEANPGDFSIHLHLAFVNGRLGPSRNAAGIGHCLAARALRPHSAGAWIALGSALYYRKDLDMAIVCYRKAIDLNPKWVAMIHIELGIALWEQRKLEEAIASYEKAIEVGPQFAAAHNNLGVALYDKGKLDEAIACYHRAIALDPKYATAHNNLGNALAGKGKVEEAIACYHKAIALDAKDATAHYNLGNALYGKGQVDEAIACWRKAIALDPKDAKAHDNLGIALAGKGQVDEAIAYFRKAVALEPTNARFQFNLGHALARQRKLGEAIRFLRKATELDPNNVAAHADLGAALSEVGKLDEAIPFLRKTIALDPKHVRAHFNLGQDLKQQGKLAEAIPCFQKASELDPQLFQAHNELAWIFATCADLKLRDPVEAVKLARQAVKLAPTDAGAWHVLGWAHYSNGAWKDSIAAFRKSMELDQAPKGGDSHQWFGLAVAQWKLGQREEARAWYGKAVQWMEKNSPKDEELLRFRAEAEEVLGKDSK
jgi:tetratricopeptide (TPR) repeat protein